MREASRPLLTQNGQLEVFSGSLFTAQGSLFFKVFLGPRANRFVNQVKASTVASRTAPTPTYVILREPGRSINEPRVSPLKRRGRYFAEPRLCITDVTI